MTPPVASDPALNKNTPAAGADWPPVVWVSAFQRGRDGVPDDAP